VFDTRFSLSITSQEGQKNAHNGRFACVKR